MLGRSFIVVGAQPFEKAFESAALTSKSRHSDTLGTTPFGHVRRPYRGLQLKDETFATLEVRTASGKPIFMENSSVSPDGEFADKYSNFVLQSVTDQRAERKQLVETFGETWIFFSGESPRTLTCSGVLINSSDFQWRNEWWHNYENYLRGTRCALSGARVYLTYDDVLVEGYMLSSGASESSQNQHLVQFQFEFLVTNYTPLITVGDTAFPNGEKGMSAVPPRAMLGEYESATLRVRRLNSRSAPTSIISAISGFLKSTKQSIAGIIKSIEHTVYGRNVRVPFGYAGGEEIANAPEFAAGSFDAGIATGSSRFKLVPRDHDLWSLTYDQDRGHTYENIDEYPARGPERPSDADLILMDESDMTIPGTDYEGRAKAIFAEHGIDTTRNMDGFGRFVTKIAFGALNFGASVAINNLRTKVKPKQLSSWSSDPGRVKVGPKTYDRTIGTDTDPTSVYSGAYDRESRRDNIGSDTTGVFNRTYERESRRHNVGSDSNGVYRNAYIRGSRNSDL